MALTCRSMPPGGGEFWPCDDGSRSCQGCKHELHVCYARYKLDFMRNAHNEPDLQGRELLACAAHRRACEHSRE
jgi:hypothetical protein